MPPSLIPVLSRADIQRKVRRLAKEISRDYDQVEILLVGILKGSFVFLADLCREMGVPVQIDFVRLASYGSSQTSSGTVEITKGLELDVRDRHVLVVEDIVDSGLTIAYFLGHLKHLGPATVKVCAFINKTGRRQVQVPIDYVGHTVDAGFLVGYGLDFDERYRALPEIYQLKT